MKITDEMIEAAKEAYRNPRRMIPNTSEGSLTTRIYAALEAALNAVPDAATEIARNLANATALTGQDARLIAEAAVMVAAAGEIAEDHALCDGRLLSVEKHAECMEAERDAALEAIERVKETLSLHNPNGRLVKEVLAALDGAPEPEWEYQCTNSINTTELLADPKIHAAQCSGKIERRRPAGPWLPVEGEKP